MSEIRALLLTDVVASTELAEKLGDAAMAQLWQAHDRIARDLLVPFCGREIDKTDGFLFLFSDAADAAGYASAYHQAIAGLSPPLRARAGVHVGPVLLRENSAGDVALGAKPLEVEGLAKPIAARVMSLANAGQTLATAAAQAQLLELTGGALQLHSHGHWRLKGVAEPLELFEVAEPSALCTAPADTAKVYRVVHKEGLWLPAREVPHNVPNQLTSFVGREAEQQQLLAALAQHRLVTLTGSGGLGKTRLALRVALASLGEFADGVWFVELAALTQPEAVPQQLAKVLGVQPGPGKTLVDAVCAHLRNQHALVLLDNCEHLVDACANLTHELLRRCAGVRVLCTSREALRLMGEHTVLLAPMPVPEEGVTLGAEQAARYAAVRLFVERVQLHSPGFDLRGGRLLAVLDICRRVEGAPLALELAAARVRALPVEEVAAKLNQRFRLLDMGNTLIKPRQQNLRAMIEWSFELLEPPEKALLASLAVFAGGWTLPCAERVCADAEQGVDEEDVALVMASLVEKSLVLADTDSGRYRMLAMIREFAADTLQASGAEASTRQRHAECFVALVDEAGPLLADGQQGPRWLQRLDLEHDNLQLMMAWLTADARTAEPADAAATALRMCWQHYRFWLVRAHWREGLQWCETSMALPGAARHALALGYAQLVACGMCERLGLAQQAMHYNGLAMAASVAGADRMLQAHVLSLQATLLMDQGDFERAAPLMLQAARLHHDLGNPRAEAVSLGNFGFGCVLFGRLDEAQAPLQRYLALARELGHRYLEASAHRHLGLLAFHQGELPKAQALLTQGLAIVRELNARPSEVDLLFALAQTHTAQGNAAAAAACLRESLRAHRKLNYPGSAADSFDATAELALQQHAAEQAALFAGVSEALRAGSPRAPIDQRRRDAERVQCIAELGEAAYEAQLALGRTQPLAEAIKAAVAWLDEVLAHSTLVDQRPPG
jgi:predicted ATPase/class 3 adenylate cyclase